LRLSFSLNRHEIRATHFPNDLLSSYQTNTYKFYVCSPFLSYKLFENQLKRLLYVNLHPISNDIKQIFISFEGFFFSSIQFERYVSIDYDIEIIEIWIGENLCGSNKTLPKICDAYWIIIRDLSSFDTLPRKDLKKTGKI
jgi:hypothetical protein